MGVCSLWSVVEPSQTKRRRMRGLISRKFSKSMDKSRRRREVVGLVDRSVGG